jgi:hypothetical protein
VRERVVFTTHTPVEAGNEAHDLDRLDGAGRELRTLPRAAWSSIGGEPFNMTVAGLRLARAANAVSELHGDKPRGKHVEERHRGRRADSIDHQRSPRRQLGRTARCALPPTPTPRCGMRTSGSSAS